MSLVRTALAVAALAAAAGCSGVSELQRCVDHSVEEGVTRDRAEQGCRDALLDD